MSENLALRCTFIVTNLLLRKTAESSVCVFINNKC